MASTGTSAADMPKSEDTLPAFAQLLTKLREEGRKLNVAGTGFDAQHNTYIVSSSYTQASTGASKPVAVRVDDATTILNASGEKLAPAAVWELKEGQEIIVSGKKSKRGVIAAQHVLV